MQRNTKLKPLAKQESVALDDEKVGILRGILSLVEQQKFILKSLEHSFQLSVQELTGVDVNDGNWELDLEQGELKRALKQPE